MKSIIFLLIALTISPLAYSADKTVYTDEDVLKTVHHTDNIQIGTRIESTIVFEVTGIQKSLESDDLEISGQVYGKEGHKIYFITLPEYLCKKAK